MTGTTSTATPTWLETPQGALATWVHLPADGRARGGVVICPPLGEEVTLAYDGLRMLADHLASAGFAALRFAYPGTGDSADFQDPSGQVDAWRQSIVSAVEFARSAGCPFVALAGLRLGATLAAEVANKCGVLGALVLWDPCITGKSFLRGQKALQTLESGPPAAREDGSEEAAGYVYPADAVRAIRAMTLGFLNLSAIHFSRDSDSCQLLVRPEDASNSVISELALSPQCRIVEAPSQSDFLGKPSFGTAIPRETLREIVEFLLERAGDQERVATKFNISKEAVVGRTDTGQVITERFTSLGPQELFGIVTEISDHPDMDCTLVCTNVSAEHHIGPHRAWVSLARSVVGDGVRTIRYDRAGVGDSNPGLSPDDVTMYTDDIRVGTVQAVGAVRTLYPGPLTAVGSCSGAWAIAAAAEARFDAVWLINPGVWRIRLSGIKGSDIAARGDRTVQEEQAESGLFTGVRAAVKQRMPYFAWLLAGRLGDARVPEIVLDRVARTGTRISVILAPPDAEKFRQQRGERGVARLRRRGTDVTVKIFDDSDHALLHEQSRRKILDTVRSEIVGLYGDKQATSMAERATR